MQHNQGGASAAASSAAASSGGAPASMDFGMSSMKRNASFIDDFSNTFDKRRITQQRQWFQVQQQLKQQHMERNKRQAECLVVPGVLQQRGAAKKSRYEVENDIENLKRNSNCISDTDDAAKSSACAEKRLRQQDYRMRLDPFVEAHMRQLKKTCTQKINAMQQQLQKVTAENEVLKSQQRTFSVAVPTLNKRYQEEHNKVVHLEQLVRQFAGDLQRVRQQLQQSERQKQLLQLHMQRGSCTAANNAATFNHFQ